MKDHGNPKVTLVIMNKNDLEGARQVVPRIDRSLFDEIFICDGGSIDGSIRYFESQGLEVCVQREGGRGGAFRTAARRASGDYVVFLSTDGEEDPADLKHFVALFSKGADMVIASRLLPGAHHKARSRWCWIHRLIYLKFVTMLINILWGSRITDCWNGYRGFRLGALRQIETDAEDFLIEAQQTIRFLKAKMDIREFPTREGERIGAASGNPILKSGWGHLVLLFRERFGW